MNAEISNKLILSLISSRFMSPTTAFIFILSLLLYNSRFSILIQTKFNSQATFKVRENFSFLGNVRSKISIALVLILLTSNLSWIPLTQSSVLPLEELVEAVSTTLGSNLVKSTKALSQIQSSVTPTPIDVPSQIQSPVPVNNAQPIKSTVSRTLKSSRIYVKRFQRNITRKIQKKIPLKWKIKAAEFLFKEVLPKGKKLLPYAVKSIKFVGEKLVKLAPSLITGGAKQVLTRLAPRVLAKMIPGINVATTAYDVYQLGKWMIPKVAPALFKVMKM